MDELTFAITLPVKSGHIGQIEIGAVVYPVPPLCACCGATDGLSANTLDVLIGSYRPGVRLAFGLCPVCHARKTSADRGFGCAALSGAGAALAAVVWLFWKSPFGWKNPLLIMGAALGAGVALGVGLGLLFHRKAFGPPHTSCADAISATATFHGSEGAFGVWRGGGTAEIRLTCRHPEFGRRLKEALARYLSA